MSRMNFFTPYIEQQEKGQSLFRKLILLGTVAVVLVLGVGGFFFFQTYAANSDIQQMQEQLAQPAMQEKQAQMEAFKTQAETGRNYLQELQRVKSHYEQIDLIDIELMDTLSSTLPTGVVFQNLSLTINQMTVTGTAPSREAIAEMEYNMEQTELFHTLHVSNITRPQAEGSFTFNLSGNFKH